MWKTLNAEEQTAIRKAQEIFAAGNQQLVWGQLEEGSRQYSELIKNTGKASDCIACGQCERACPQQIDVISRLQDCAVQFDY